MTGNEARKRPSLLARLFRRRSAEAADMASSAGPEPPLLDQIGAGRLMRVGADRLGPQIHLPTEGTDRIAVSARGGGGIRQLFRRGLPLVFLLFGAVMIAGLSFGTVSSLTDEGGVSGGDILRLVVMALISLAVLGQALAVLRSLPGGRWLTAQAGRPWRGLAGLLNRPSAADTASAGGPLLLDQISTVQLMELAPESLGEGSSVASAARRGRRVAGAGGWFILLLAVTALTAFATAGLAFVLVRSLTDGGGLAIGVILPVAFLTMMSMALVFLGRTAGRSVTDIRQRRPIRLLRRLSRYLLRWFDQGSSFAGGAPAPGAASAASGASGVALGGGIGLQLVATVVAAATVAGLGFGPPLMEAVGDGGIPSAAGPSPTPVVLSIDATPTPTPTPQATTPTPIARRTPAATPEPTATATPTAEATRIATAEATPTATAEATPAATAEATPTATAEATPTATAEATPTATAEATPTATAEATPTATAEATPTATAEATPTATAEATPTATAEATPIATAEATLTPTPTPLPWGDILGQIAGGGPFCDNVLGCYEVSLCPEGVNPSTSSNWSNLCTHRETSSDGEFSFLDVPAPDDYTIVFNVCSGPILCMVPDYDCEDIHLDPGDELFVTIPDGGNEYDCSPPP